MFSRALAEAAVASSMPRNLSSCRCSCLEQFTPARHFCTFVTPQDSPVYYFQSLMHLFVQCTLIARVTYFLQFSLYRTEIGGN